MKIKDCFILRNIAGINTIISTDSTSSFDGMITLNETGVFMWNILKNGATKNDLVNAVISEYDIDKETASADIDAFLAKLASVDVFEYNL